MYEKIYDFCKVRNKGNIFSNDESPTPRVKFLMNLLNSENITYELDKFFTEKVTGYNIILKGTSNRMVVAHHDVNNHKIDNANDNSCSVINAIMTKINSPSTTVILLDGEEPPMMGVGSQRASDKMNAGEYGNIEWVLNLELSGKGGKHFFIGSYKNKLSDHIKSLFNCPIVKTPFNDAEIFVKNGIASTVINPLPPIVGRRTGRFNDVISADGTPLDFSILYKCHSMEDNVASIDPIDMQEFVEEIVLKILA